MSAPDLQQLRAEAVQCHQSGDLAGAEIRYAQILALEPHSFTANHLFGMLRTQQGRGAEALALLDRALAIKPDHPGAQYLRANALLQLGRKEDAVAGYGRALALKPDFPEALNNRGNLQQSLGRHDEALASYDRALALNPGNVMALNNRGITLRSLGRREEALASYDQALSLNPDFASAHSNRGKLLFDLHRIDEGLAALRRAAELGLRPEPPGPPPPHRLRHDREQQDYLGGTDDGRLSLEGGERIAGPALNSADAAAISERWRGSKPQLVVIDNLLTAEALAGLRRFCLGSKIWRKAFDDGYLGAFPEHGFACPLLAQIAEEFRAVFPAIFGAHPLHNLWAFKYDSTLSGINVHADEAAVNVNFWITPDEANLDPASGGLKVWDVDAPLDWDFLKFNGDVAATRDFLRRSGAKSITVPYRANRAVIFDSDLFHETDRIAFKEGYLNRRINVTLLYGRREAGRAA